MPAEPAVVVTPAPWPLDLGRYDRTPALSAAEQAALDRVAGCREGRVHARSLPALQRLVQPLLDVLNRFPMAEDTRSGVIRIVVLEMQQRRTAFWAWTPAEWTAIVGPTYRAFDRRYGRAPTSHNPSRAWLPVLAYLLGEVPLVGPLARVVTMGPLARKIFGPDAVTTAVAQLTDTLQAWGYSARDDPLFVAALCYLLLRNRSPRLEDLTSALLETIAAERALPCTDHGLPRIAHALAALGIIARPLPDRRSQGVVISGTDGSLADEWLAWCQRWRDHSSLTTRRANYYVLLKVGRWLRARHPEITSPAQWTYELAAEFVAAVDQLTVGDWADAHCRLKQPALLGRPLRPNAKAQHLSVLRVFLRDCQEWGWIPVTVNPFRALRTPPALQRLVGPDPRVIDQALWAKLVWAALNLTEADLIYHKGRTTYPLELVAALAVVWCFSALRRGEIVRLRVGCVRQAREDLRVPETGEVLPKDAVCFLDVPAGKSGRAYSKPVHPVVGERIAAWEAVRPAAQRRVLDARTGEAVHYLFTYREQQVGAYYLNDTLIPLLCRKAGIPEQDTRGQITSHRARATIASLLYNAKEPLSIYELMAYLGHRELRSTQYYVKVDATKLASDVGKANYLEQNLATVAVLLDQAAVLSGAAARGAAWKYYDLGHGFCTNAFWAQCAHRMACARCPFYRPKESLAAQMVEGQANLVRMLEFVRLTDEERKLVEEGIALHQALIDKLADTPTPAGPTPRQLEAGRPGESALIPVSAIQAKTSRPRE